MLACANQFVNPESAVDFFCNGLQRIEELCYNVASHNFYHTERMVSELEDSGVRGKLSGDNPDAAKAKGGGSLN